ncbi:MAG: hypothetical protein SF069_14070 [Phycisphaerae bacterium]|nr:hypothetical protein [Phycisphaerae bacterium]
MIPSDFFESLIAKQWSPGSSVAFIAGNEIGDWDFAKGPSSLSRVLHEQQDRLGSGRIAGMRLLHPRQASHVFFTLLPPKKIVMIGWGSDCPLDANNDGLIDLVWGVNCLRSILQDYWPAVLRITFEVV